MTRQFTDLRSKIAYSVDELADATSISKEFFRIEIRNGRLKAKKIGRRVLVLQSDLDDYLSNLESAGNACDK